MTHREMSLERIATLHPTVAAKALEWYNRCWAEGIRVFVVFGYRSIGEQAALYAKGRTTKGPKVTNAAPGRSYHNHRLALDYCLLDNQGRAVWDVNAQWRRAAAIAKSLGFTWGGDWRGFVDYPHLEMTFGYSINQLLAGKHPPVLKEEEEAMTKEEKEAFVALQASVLQLADLTKQQEVKIEALEKRLKEVPAPTWAKAAADYYGPYFGQKTGTIDFWRGLVVQHNKEKAAKK